MCLHWLAGFVLLLPLLSGVSTLSLDLEGSERVPLVPAYAGDAGKNSIRSAWGREQRGVEMAVD